MTKNLALSKHRYAVTFVDFSLQCKLEVTLRTRIETGQRANCNRPKSCSTSESLLWALILDLSQRQPKCHFSWRVTRKGDFLTRSLEETSWYWVGTELTLARNCFAPAPTRWCVVPFALTHIRVIIVSGYLEQTNFKSSEVNLSCNQNLKTHMSISVPLFQCTSL